MEIFSKIRLCVLQAAALFVSATGTYAASPSISDSLLTADHDSKYAYPACELAQLPIGVLQKKQYGPEYKSNISEGDRYYNTGHYYQALRFYGRAIENKQIRDDAEQYMELLHRMISCYDCICNEAKKAQYVEMLLEKADACGNQAMRSVALFNRGKMLYNQGYKDQGYRDMQQAAEQMSRTNCKYRYDHLRHQYNTLLVFQESDHRNGEALQTLDALEKVVTDKEERKAMIARRAVILYRSGLKREADENYRQFLALGKPTDRDNDPILPYLFDRGLYDEVIRMNSACEKTLSAEGDTVSDHMAAIKESLGRAYLEKGDYKTAALYFEQLALLRDSIRNRERKSAAQELAAVYETGEKELRTREQAAKHRLRTIGLAFVCCIVFLTDVLLWRAQRHSRIIRRKNESMVSTIEELLKYKDSLYLQREQISMLQEKLDGKRCSGVSIHPAGGEEACHSDKGYCMDEESEETGTNYDRHLFDRIERKIIGEKLFLQSDFSREKLLKIIFVPKNKFGQLFRQFAGTNFPEYVNNLRLDYAAKMLREYPDYTIDAIAKSCGMSTVQTFHRLFLKKFGVTPMEFRTGIKRADK